MAELVGWMTNVSPVTLSSPGAIAADEIGASIANSTRMPTNSPPAITPKRTASLARRQRGRMC